MYTGLREAVTSSFADRNTFSCGSLLIKSGDTYRIVLGFHGWPEVLGSKSTKSTCVTTASTNLLATRLQVFM